MPVVPRVSGPSVEQAPLPNAQITARADAGTFGAEAWDAVQRGAFRAMDQKIQAAKHEEEKLDTAQVMSARNELSTWENSWFDPNNQQGVRAYQGKDALSLQEVMRQDYQRHVSSLTMGLANDQQRQAFGNMSAQFGEQVRSRVNNYAYGESQKYQQEAFKASLATSSSVAATAARDGDMDRVDKELTLANALIDENARLTGEPPELVSARKQELLSQTTLAGVNGMVSAGRTQDAEAFWLANREDMSGSDRINGAKAIMLGRIQSNPEASAYALSASVPPSVQGGGTRVAGTPIAQIRTDAAAAGIPPTTALAISHLESGLNPDARPMKNGKPLSSAAGLFQLLDSSRQQYSGSSDVGDVAAQSKAGVAYIADSYKALRGGLGREPEPHEVYMAHLFGQAGAQAVLKAPDDARIIDVVRTYDKRNATDIVQNNGMAGMTVAAVKERWRSRMGQAMTAVAGIPEDAPAQADGEALPDERAADPVIASLPIENRIQLQSAAEAEARQIKATARADLDVRVKDAVTALSRGEQPPQPLTYADFASAYGPSQAAREFEDYRGWQQFGSDVGQLKTMPAADMTRYLEQRKPVAGEEGYADDARRYDALAQAADHVGKARAADPIQAALQAGGSSVRPIDWQDRQSVPDQLALRVAGAQQVSSNYGTPLAMFTKEEATQLAAAARVMPTAQKVGLLRDLRADITDPRAFASAMGQIAPDQPVLAVAGSIMQKQEAMTISGGWFSANEEFKQGDVAGLMIEGDALLNPTSADRKEDGRTKGFQMPTDRDMRDVFNSAVGDSFAGDAGGADLAYQAARAYYAGTAARAGRIDGVMDPRSWEKAIRAATGGVVDFNGRGDVRLPWGMPEDVFDDEAAVAFARATSLPAENLMDYGLQNIGDGRYLVRSGTDYLRSAAGAPVQIDLYANPQRTRVTEPAAGGLSLQVKPVTGDMGSLIP